MADTITYVLSTFEWNIHPGYQTGIKFIFKQLRKYTHKLVSYIFQFKIPNTL